jgi:5-methylcytosine-specific restriction endonuclease McrA
MKKHTAIYMNHFGYDINDFIPCEVCGGRAVDIHHIEARGAGGDPQGKKDVITNLQALCRACHVEMGDKKQYKEFLKERHLIKLTTNKVSTK